MLGEFGSPGDDGRYEGRMYRLIITRERRCLKAKTLPELSRIEKWKARMYDLEKHFHQVKCKPTAIYQQVNNMSTMLRRSGK